MWSECGLSPVMLPVIVWSVFDSVVCDFAVFLVVRSVIVCFFLGSVSVVCDCVVCPIGSVSVVRDCVGCP